MPNERKRPPPILTLGAPSSFNGAAAYVGGCSTDGGGAELGTEIANWLNSIKPGYSRFGPAFAAAGFEDLHDIAEYVTTHGMTRPCAHLCAPE